MKNLKKLLVLLIVLLIIITIAIVILKNNKNKKDVQNLEPYENEEIVTNNIKLVDNPIMYFTAQSCVEKYINCLNENDPEKIYNILDTEYIKEHSITKANVLKHVEEVYEMPEFQTQKMYVEEINENIEKYYVKGVLGQYSMFEEDSEYNEEREFIVTIIINHENMTFSVIPFGHGGVFDE